MTDLKLLELAAKAAGLNVKAHRVDSDDKFTHLIVGKKNTREKVLWNPLTEDGDALRLAVKLNFGISLPVHKTIIADVICFRNSAVNIREVGTDRYAATRRAIVRTAAEIGKQLQG